MDYFIKDTEKRIEVVNKKIDNAATPLERLILEKQKSDLELLREVMIDVKKKARKQESILGM